MVGRRKKGVSRSAQAGVTTHFGDGIDWFCQARFGLFVHWGIYAV